MRSRCVYPGIPLVMKTARIWLVGLGLAIFAAACAGGQTSNPGTGGSGPGTGGTGIMCTAPLQPCSGQCTDTSSDSNNCGSCGIPCGAGRTCQGGECKCP